MEDIILCARQYAPENHIVVVHLGSNNIRDGEKPEDLIGFFKNIVEELAQIPNCLMVLVSLVPSFARDEELKEDFHQFSLLLKALVDLHAHVSFCNWVRKLFVEGNWTKMDPDCFADRVHLSRKGAEIFADALFKHLQHLPRI